VKLYRGEMSGGHNQGPKGRPVRCHAEVKLTCLPASIRYFSPFQFFLFQLTCRLFGCLRSLPPPHYKMERRRARKNNHSGTWLATPRLKPCCRVAFPAGRHLGAPQPSCSPIASRSPAAPSPASDNGALVRFCHRASSRGSQSRSACQKASQNKTVLRFNQFPTTEV